MLQNIIRAVMPTGRTVRNGQGARDSTHIFAALSCLMSEQHQAKIFEQAISGIFMTVEVSLDPAPGVTAERTMNEMKRALKLDQEKLDGLTNSDYAKYRGRCKEFAEKAIAQDPSLELVRGWYHCPLWGKQAHWWCVKPDGTIVDPTVAQFPTKGAGATYEEFDGFFDCEFCGKSVEEEKGYRYEQHFYCSYECFGHDVGF